MSLYNKYRPASFEDFLQSKYVKTLKEDFSHHAYLFFGPPGTGKTSAARLCMAEARRATESPDVYISGKHPDYHEINCAVNNGVDDVRNIISDIVNTIPVQSTHKFIIFDECHMLTNQSQNALLKTVEEPPKHVKFIFCTTEVNKVLPAIRSRCQVIPFMKIDNENLRLIVERVCEKEKIEYLSEAIDIIVSLSEGSARTAINLLEQCSSVMSDITALTQMLGTASIKSFHQLTKMICDGLISDSIIYLDNLLSNAVDPASLMNQYADYVASMIILRLKDKTKCEFEGKKLLNISKFIVNTQKDFKILQNIKLIAIKNLLLINE